MTTWHDKVPAAAGSSLVTLVLVLAVFSLLDWLDAGERAEDLRVDALVAETQRDYQEMRADEALAVVQAMREGRPVYLVSPPPGYRISAERTTFLMADGTEVTLADLINRITGRKDARAPIRSAPTRPNP